MNTFIVNEYDFYMMEADMYINKIEVLTSYEEIFEANNISNDVKLQNNQKAGGGVLAAISNAINALINFIGNIINNIRSFFVEATFSKAEKEAFELYKQAVAKDPSLKNKTVNALDFVKYQSEYNKYMDNIKRAEASKDQGIFQQAISKAQEFLKDGAKALTIAVGMEAALRMATTGPQMARVILNELNKNQNLLNQMKRSIGEKNVKDFQKNLDSQTSYLKRTVSLSGLKVKIFHGHYDTIFQATQSIFADCTNLCSAATGITVDSIREGKGKIGTLFSALGTFFGSSDNRKAGRFGATMAKTLNGNGNVKNAIKTVSQTAGRIQNNARRARAGNIFNRVVDRLTPQAVKNYNNRSIADSFGSIGSRVDSAITNTLGMNPFF